MTSTEDLAETERDIPLSLALLEAVGPDVYRANTFRLAEIPVHASPKELSRRRQFVELAVRSGAPVPQGPGRALPLKQEIDPDILRESLQRLHDPERRLIEELFWFWPQQLQGDHEPALVALAKGDVEGAREAWIISSHGSETAVSVHNLAVLAHTIALDYEHRLAAGERLSTAEVKERDACWEEALRRWREVIQQPGFWSRLRARIRDLDYPQLTTGAARRLRETLPLALLSINSTLAVRAAEGASTKEARRQTRLMIESGFDATMVEDAVERAARPLRERITTLCGMAESQARVDREHADIVCERLMEQTKSPLDALDALLPRENRMLEAAHDDVALSALTCQICYGNKADDWKTSIALLESAVERARSESARARLSENLKICRANEMGGGSWCVRGYYDLPSTLLEPLEAAHQHAESRRWDQAISALTALLTDSRFAGGHEEYVRRALAYCLNHGSLQRVNEATTEANGESTLRRKIRAQSILLGGIRLALPYGLSCEACGGSIYGNYARFTFDGESHTVCSSCAAEGRREMEGQKSRLRDALGDAMGNLLWARELLPGDAAIEDTITQLRKAASVAGISLPSKPRRRKVAARAAAPKAGSARRSLLKELGWITFAICLLVLVRVLVMLFT
jgi:hypothetical protein